MLNRFKKVVKMFPEVNTGLFSQNQSKNFLRYTNHEQDNQETSSILLQSVGSLANILLSCFRKWRVNVSVFSNSFSFLTNDKQKVNLLENKG